MEIDSQIRLSIFPHKDGHGIGMRSLSRGALAFFKAKGAFRVPEGVDTMTVKGERLSFHKTKKAAIAWRNGFYALPLDKQLAIVGSKWVNPFEYPKQDNIIKTVQYYRVMRGNVLVDTTYDQEKLKRYQSNPRYTIVASVKKQMKFNKEYWNKNQFRVDTHTAIPGAGHKGEMAIPKGIKTIRK